MVTASIATPALTTAPSHPLREHNFRLLFTGTTISLLGDQFYFVALPWLVLQQTGSAIAMGAIMMTAAIPRAVLMLMGGAVSDRISPRKVLLIAGLVRAFLVAGLGGLIWLHFLYTWQLYVLAAGFGTADAFDSPAAQAYMPSLVKPEQLVAATSVSQVRTQLATIIGPAPAGLAIKTLGLAWGFFIDAASFLFMIGALLKLPDPPANQNAKKPLWHSVVEGLQYVRNDVPLRSLLLVMMGLNFCLAGPVSLGLVYLAKTRFESPAFLGIMLSAVGAGALGGALLAGVWKIRRRGIMILALSLVLAALVSSLGLLSGKWTIPALLLVMGLCVGLTNVQIGSWIMQRIDASVRGRVSSVLSLGGIGTVPISLALAGLLIAVSLKLMFLIAGSIILLVTITAATQKIVRQIE
jgi:MFS family permease